MKTERQDTMDLGLSGKRALVTGSTAGIGLAIAATLAREGAKVIVNGRTQARIDEAVAQVKEQAGAKADVRGLPIDLGTAAGAKQVIGELSELDVLVNN